MAKDDMEKRQAEFLRQITALSRKLRVGIGGCGCCGSPFLTEIQGPVRSRKYEIDDCDGRLRFTDVQ